MVNFERPQITPEDLSKASDVVRLHMISVVHKHGLGAFISAHESLGQVTEEYDELIGAVQKDKDSDKYIQELKDIAAVCIFAIASYYAMENDSNG